MESLQTIDRPGGDRRLVSWSVDDGGSVTMSPSAALERARVAAAADGVAELTLDELTLAAVCASEDGGASAVTLAALCDATVNRAALKGRSVFQAATGGEGFGRQGGDRPMSTRLAPRLRHMRAAVAVLRGDARGVSRGARAWFHHKTQDRLATQNPAKHCPARVILERWCFGSQWRDRSRCELGPRQGRPLQWIGPLDGVDHHSLFLFQAGGSEQEHGDRYRAALRVLDGGGDLATAVAVGLAVISFAAILGGAP